MNLPEFTQFVHVDLCKKLRNRSQKEYPVPDRFKDGNRKKMSYVGEFAIETPHFTKTKNLIGQGLKTFEVERVFFSELLW